MQRCNLAMYFHGFGKDVVALAPNRETKRAAYAGRVRVRDRLRVNHDG